MAVLNHDAHHSSSETERRIVQFSSRLPLVYVKELIKSDVITVIPSKKYRSKLSKAYFKGHITNDNRPNLWLKASGGENQIRDGKAFEIFEYRTKNENRNTSMFWRQFDSNEHTCLVNQNPRQCCLIEFNSSVGTSHNCHNPLCSKFKKSLSGSNISSCCIFYCYSKWLSDLAMVCDPTSDYIPLLPYMSNMFAHVFNNDHEIFSCLLGLLRHSDKTILDKTHIKSRITAAVLRWFLRDLCRLIFRSSEITNPLLRQLFELDPQKFFTPLDDTSKNPWLFYDWSILLFQYMSGSSLLNIVDRLLICGVRELYRCILFYFCNLFINLNNKGPENSTSKFDPNLILSTLAQIIATTSACSQNPSTSPLRRLKITNKIIHSYSDRLFGILISFIPSSIESSNTLISVNSDQDWPSPVLSSSEWTSLFAWLPQNIQLLSPILSYSSNVDGWSLQTLYHKSEQFEPILVLVKTECFAIFGGYIPVSLKTRIKMGVRGSSFGTGESFVFSLRPEPFKYTWAEIQDVSDIIKDDFNNKENSHRSKSVSETESSESVKSKKPIFNLLNIKKHIRKKRHVSLDDVELVILSDRPYSKELMDIKSNSPSTFTCPEIEYPEGPNDIFVVADDDSLAIGGGGGYAIFLDKTLTTGTSQTCCTFRNKPFVSHSHGCFKSAVVEVFRFVDSSLS